jgi:hypothetical protein
VSRRRCATACTARRASAREAREQLGEIPRRRRIVEDEVAEGLFDDPVEEAVE